MQTYAHDSWIEGEGFCIVHGWKLMGGFTRRDAFRYNDAGGFVNRLRGQIRHTD